MKMSYGNVQFIIFGLMRIGSPKIGAKLSSQEYISVKIPTVQLLNQSLNIYDFYRTRIDEKFALANLKEKLNFLINRYYKVLRH
jgi:hypothetical protein